MDSQETRAIPLAIRQIYATKGRPAGHPVIVHMADGADLSTIAQLDDRAQALASAFWPDPDPHPAQASSRARRGDRWTGDRGDSHPDHPLTQAVYWLTSAVASPHPQPIDLVGESDVCPARLG